MIGGIVHSQLGVTLLGGGQSSASDVNEALTIAPVLVAADGGADRALALGHMPRAVIGDFDSISDEARGVIAPDRLHPIPEQDSTDFGKCLAHVRAPFYLALGFAGRRLDHTLSAFATLAACPAQRVVMIGDDDVVFLAPPDLELDLPGGTRLSLFPMGPVEGASVGLRWPIDGIAFAPSGRIGTSNEVTGPVRLSLAGPMLVLVPRFCLRPALHGLGVRPDVHGE